MGKGGITFDVNFHELSQEYEATIDDMVEATDQATHRIAFKVMAQAKKITPVDSGRLRDSAEVNKLGIADYSIVYPVHYAIYVHERTELQHEKPPQARAKFLERAFRVIGEVADNDLQDEIGKVLD